MVITLTNEKLRLQKYIADCGICSRRSAELLIEAGRVTVNGRLARIGDSVIPNKDYIKLDNVVLSKKTEKKKYYMLYKPRGFITTLNDELGRKCVSDLLRSIPSRVYPVGRLDRESEGLLLLTDDGELANKLTQPKSHVAKVYRVTVEGSVAGDKIEKIRAGMELEDGYVTAPAKVEVKSVKEDRTVLTITLFEGKNRQIRRMCEILELPVILLKREKLGNISLGTLRPGQIRELKDNEIEYLKSL